jgi:Spy/CpxP family protein refolding chaperone
MKRNLYLFFVALVALLACAHRARADKGDDLREKLREKVKAMRIARMIEALDLDEKTTAKVMPIVDKAMDDLSNVAKDAGTSRRALRQMIQTDKPDDNQINKLVDNLMNDRDQSKGIEDQMIKDLRKVLTPEQAAKLVVVLPEINRGLEQRIRKAAMRRMQQQGGEDEGP